MCNTAESQLADAATRCISWVARSAPRCGNLRKANRPSSGAATLASRAELDVGRLAELTGFTDASAFARAFRRWTGERPRAFMRRVRERASQAESG